MASSMSRGIGFAMIRVALMTSGVLASTLLAEPAWSAHSPKAIEDSRLPCVFLMVEKNGDLVGQTGKKIDTLDKVPGYLDEMRERHRREQSLVDALLPSDFVLVIRSDKDVRYERLWDILDVCKKAGYSRWQLRVKATD
jgi:biopolymer transport protein ExbD